MLSNCMTMPKAGLFPCRGVQKMRRTGGFYLTVNGAKAVTGSLGTDDRQFNLSVQARF